MTQFFGKYRGTVVNNADPMRIGRIQALVPDVSGATPTTWAMPCVPVAGPGSGAFILPPVGAAVWMEFEQGNPDQPIWTGGFWRSAAEVPSTAVAAAPDTQSIVVQTPGQHQLVISDAAGPVGGITLKSASGGLIAINESGVTISNGQGATIVLTGPAVAINDGALAVV